MDELVNSEPIRDVVFLEQRKVLGLERDASTANARMFNRSG